MIGGKSRRAISDYKVGRGLYLEGLNSHMDCTVTYTYIPCGFGMVCIVSGMAFN